MIHLLGAGVLTLYFTYYWQRERMSLKEAEGRRICGMFAGCIPGKETNLTRDELKTACHMYTIEHCAGTHRCCLDCRSVISLTREHKRQPSHVVFSFEDEHGPSVSAAGIGVLLHFVLYVVLLVTRRVEKNRVKLIRKEDRAVNMSLRHRASRTMTGLLLLLAFFLLTSITVYSVSYTVCLWDVLRNCQATLFMLLSWDIVLILSSVDYCLSFLPTTICVLKSKGKSKQTGNLHLLQAVSDKIVNCIGGALFFWWVFLGIYLEGVHRGRWMLPI